jgi:hypothetical protein
MLTAAGTAAAALALGLWSTALPASATSRTLPGAQPAASPVPVSPDPAAAPAGAPADSVSGVSSVADGHAGFDLTGKVPGLTIAGTDGAATVGSGARAATGVRMWVARGTLDHSRQRFTGGTAVLSGGFTLRLADRTAALDHLTLDLASGELRARLAGRPLLLGTMDTAHLHVSSASGQRRVMFAVRGELRLSAVAAGDLNRALNTGRFAAGDALARAEVCLCVPLDRPLASDLGIGYEAALHANIQADIQRGAPTDLGLGLL